MNKYNIGDIIECKVTGIENYGVFVDVDGSYSGLIHISEITHGFVRRVEDYVKKDDFIYCKVIHVDEENLRLRLSIKELEYNNLNAVEHKIVESKSGFTPLKQMLPEWTESKIKELN